MFQTKIQLLIQNILNENSVVDSDCFGKKTQLLIENFLPYFRRAAGWEVGICVDDKF